MNWEALAGTIRYLLLLAFGVVVVHYVFRPILIPVLGIWGGGIVTLVFSVSMYALWKQWEDRRKQQRRNCRECKQMGRNCTLHTGEQHH